MANSLFLDGDVSGPATATDGAVAVFSGTTGKVIKVGTGSGGYVSSIAGTANQIVASAATGAVTLSLSPTLTGIDSLTFSGGQSLVGTTPNSLVYTGTGPNAFGFSSASGSTQWQTVWGGAYSPAYASVGGMMRMVTQLTIPAASGGVLMDPRGLSIQAGFNFNNQAGTVDQINMFEADPLVVTNAGSATIRTTTIIGTFGDSQATVTDKNYSIWSHVGAATATWRLDGTMYFGPLSDASITAGNAVSVSSSGTNVLSILNGTKAAGATVVIGDGQATAPSLARFGQTGTGLWFASNAIRFSHSGTYGAELSSGRLTLYQNIGLGLSAGAGAADVLIQRGAANRILIENAGESVGAALDTSVNGTFAVLSLAGADTAIVRSFGYTSSGYSSGARSTTSPILSATEAVTLSGASTATTNIIPAGATVEGIATTTTTTITGATGYQVGDGSDADRYGDITGTAVGTASGSTNYTADPRWWTNAARAVTLTAKTSNFTGGVVQVTVFYRTAVGA